MRDDISLDGEPKQRAARVMYSLFKAGARIAYRAGISKNELVALLELAYFEELRRHHPKDLAAVAEKLGISLRTAGSLNMKLKQMFFFADRYGEATHGAIRALQDGAKTLEQLQTMLPTTKKKDLVELLDQMVDEQWIIKQESRFALASRLRLHVDGSFLKAIDGLNQQLALIANGLWLRFVEEHTEEVIGRTWTFSVPISKMRVFAQTIIQKIRYDLVDLEEKSQNEKDAQRFGMTITITKTEENP